MAQSLLDLEEKVNQLNHLIQEKGDGLVQQIISSAHYLCFQTRFKGQTQYIYLGRGGGFQGMGMSDVKLSAPRRVQDKFLQYARKNWRGMRIKKVSVPVKDRVLEIEGSAGPSKLKVWFFWKGRDLYFADKLVEDKQQRLFQSWIGKSRLSNEIEIEAEDIFSELDLRNLEEGIGRSTVLNIDKYLDKDKGEGTKPIPQLNKKLKKKITRMKEDLSKFEILSFLEKQTEKDLENLKGIGEGRFSVSFRGLEGHFKKREYLFNKIKKWRVSKRDLEKRLKAIESIVEGEAPRKVIAAAKTKDIKIIQPVWKTQKEGPAFEIKSTHVYFQYDEFQVYVGRSATESDKIRKDIAKKNDLWLHLDGHKSGHMFVKGDREPRMDELSVLGSALVDYSGLKIADIPLLFTQVKNLKGVKGVAGMVNYKKEKHLLVIYDAQWRQKVTAIDDGSEG